MVVGCGRGGRIRRAGSPRDVPNVERQINHFGKAGFPVTRSRRCRGAENKPCSMQVDVCFYLITYL